MRRSRVTSRGEPGGRWNPRDLSALATASMLTARRGDASTIPRTTETSSSWGAVVWEGSGCGAGRGAGHRPPRPPPARPPRGPPCGGCRRLARSRRDGAPRTLAAGRRGRDLGAGDAGAIPTRSRPAAGLSGSPPSPPALPQATVGQSAELDPQAGGDVADGVERAVVRDDLDDVPGARRGQPDARSDRDAQVAPVPDARRGRAVDQVCAARGEQPRRLVSHDAPVRDSHELRPAVPGIHPQVFDDVREMLGAARVLDVEEDRAPPGGRGRSGSGGGTRAANVLSTGRREPGGARTPR